MPETQDRYDVGNGWRTTNNRDTARELAWVLADREGCGVPVRDTRTGAEWSVAPDGRMTQKAKTAGDVPGIPPGTVEAAETPAEAEE